MASTNFIDKTTVVATDWLNEVNGTVWTLFGAATTASAGRTALGLGTIATQNSNNVTITGGTITGLSSPLPVASGGTGATNSTGAGSVVLQNNPTLNSAGVSGLFSTSSSSGGDFVQFINTAAGAEPAVRVDTTQNTSGAALKLSNSGLNKQVSLRVNNTGGFNLYVNQTAGGTSTSGQNAFLVDASGNLAFNGTVNTSGTLSENGTRVFSRNSMAQSPEYNLNSVAKQLVWDSGLGAQPTLIQVFIKNVALDAGFDTGDIIYLSSGTWTGGSMTVSANETSDVIVVSILGNINLVQLGAPPTTSTNIDFSKWNIFIRAWY